LAAYARGCPLEGPIDGWALIVRGGGLVAAADARGFSGSVAIRLTTKASSTQNRVPLTHATADRARWLRRPPTRA